MLLNSKTESCVSTNLKHVLLNSKTESCVSTNLKHVLLNSKTESCVSNLNMCYLIVKLKVVFQQT